MLKRWGCPKRKKFSVMSFPRKRESSIDAVFWIPACAGMTSKHTF